MSVLNIEASFIMEVLNREVNSFIKKTLMQKLHNLTTSSSTVLYMLDMTPEDIARKENKQ